MIGEPFVDFVLLALLVTTAFAIARLRNLLATAMLTGIFSLLGACWMLFLDAPDVAFTEAAVGAGISTILILATLCVVEAEEKESAESPLALVAVLATGAVLVYGTLGMPHYGDPGAPATVSPITRAYLYSANPPAEHGEHHALEAGRGLDAYAVGIPNTVTTVLASFRGYDTMGETAVIFTAGLGVVMILGGARRRRLDPSEKIDLGGGRADELHGEGPDV
jgi:multicomponent Na+:H+ antiporter subunit B